MQTQLNTPYGGQLVNQCIAMAAVSTQDLPILVVGEVVETDFINLATGILSPLNGFMGRADFRSVCESSRLQSGLAWTIPVVLDIDDADIRLIADQARVLVQSSQNGRLLGYIEPTEIYSYDKAVHIQATFGTEDTRHPGVAWVQSSKPHLLAGRVTAFVDALDDDPLSYPAGVRRHLEKMGLKTVVGFQTRNIIHRAHEYLQRIGLEVCDGLLVHPIVGWKKKGDFRPAAVKKVYSEFIRDFYPPDRVVLAFLKTAMRYAGPKEAVFHAIIRRNFGCSHFIVGRDHAGVGSYYGLYEAHQIFDTLPDLGIEILRLHGPFYCQKCKMIVTEKTCGHGAEYHDAISGTKVREILSGGNDPAEHYLRNEVLQYLRPLIEQGEVFYD